MLQMHPSVPLAAKAQCSTTTAVSAEFHHCDPNSAVWLLMGDVRSLLQNDVEETETANRLRAPLAKLVPALQKIQDNQFETGLLSALLHATADSPDAIENRFKEFRTLSDTLDELLIRLEWNLPVSELVPFADLRLAQWMSQIRDFANRQAY